MAKKKAKEIILTDAQMAALKPYEENMRTAVESDWTRGLGTNGAKLMAGIRNEVVGGGTYVNTSCPVCMLDLCRRVGKWYFNTLQARADAAVRKTLQAAEVAVEKA